MTPAKVRAYNRGIADMIALARATSAALASAAVDRVTRIGFAQAALDGLAGEGTALLLPVPSDAAPPPA